MRKRRYALFFLVLLALGVCLAVPVADVAETAYDESEALPYENTPLISEQMTQAATSAEPVIGIPGQSGAPFRATARQINSIHGHRLAEAQVNLAFLCTLLC